jgi:hypothetical protein
LGAGIATSKSRREVLNHKFRYSRRLEEHRSKYDEPTSLPNMTKETARMALLLRLVKAAVFGALLIGMLAAGVFGFLGAIRVITGENDIDRAHDQVRLPGIILFATVAGAVTGSLAAVASRAPKNGVPFSISLLLISASAGAVRLATESGMKDVNENLPWHARHSYGLSIVAAVTMCLVLLIVRKGKSRDERL